MQQIGKYKIIEEPLSEGGFGAVYLSEDEAGQVAIKVFQPKDATVVGLVTSATSDATGLWCTNPDHNLDGCLMRVQPDASPTHIADGGRNGRTSQETLPTSEIQDSVSRQQLA